MSTRGKAARIVLHMKVELAWDALGISGQQTYEQLLRAEGLLGAIERLIRCAVERNSISTVVVGRCTVNCDRVPVEVKGCNRTRLVCAAVYLCQSMCGK
jgi:hypothetical protein